MAEPLQSASTVVTDAAADNEDDPSSRLPKNAEDRKAAAALNSLKATEISQDETSSNAAKQPSKADQEALGKAMSWLETASGAGAAKKKDNQKKTDDNQDVVVKKKIKVASEDVNFLVDELDLTKPRATELLRDHDGDVVRAARAFIAPPARG